MEIKYAIIDFNKEDNLYLPIFTFIGLIDFTILINNIQIFSIENIFLVFHFVLMCILLVYPRFIKSYLLKKQTKIEFLQNEIFIKNKYLEKEIRYVDINKIVIRKNYFNSYDILINNGIIHKWTEKNRSKYLYYFEKDLHKNDFVFCDIKNIDEIEEFLINKIGFNKNFIENKDFKKIYAKECLSDISQILSSIIFIIFIICFLTLAKSNPKELFSYFIISFILFFVINSIKIIPRKYDFLEIDKIRILIKNKNIKIYIFDDFEYENNKIKIKNYKGNRISKEYYKKFI